jgi:hypothetical protein
MEPRVLLECDADRTFGIERRPGSARCGVRVDARFSNFCVTYSAP